MAWDCWGTGHLRPSGFEVPGKDHPAGPGNSPSKLRPSYSVHSQQENMVVSRLLLLLRGTEFCQQPAALAEMTAPRTPSCQLLSPEQGEPGPGLDQQNRA